jgi:hypothetical protein
MEPENSFRRLMPRKDELQASRFTEAGTLPAPHSPAFSHVPSLWDYWPIVLRHKWTILSAMLVALLVGAVVSFSTTPIYEAVGRVVINREGAETAGLKNSDTGGSDSYDDYMVAMDTQTHVLQSDAIAKLVIRRLNLDSDPAFAGKGAVSASSTPDASPAQTRYIEPHRESGLVGKFHGSLQINSIPGHACWRYGSRAPTQVWPPKRSTLSSTPTSSRITKPDWTPPRAPRTGCRSNCPNCR